MRRRHKVIIMCHVILQSFLCPFTLKLRYIFLAPSSHTQLNSHRGCTPKEAREEGVRKVCKVCKVYLPVAAMARANQCQSMPAMLATTKPTTLYLVLSSTVILHHHHDGYRDKHRQAKRRSDPFCPPPSLLPTQSSVTLRDDTHTSLNQHTNTPTTIDARVVVTHCVQQQHQQQSGNKSRLETKYNIRDPKPTRFDRSCRLTREVGPTRKRN